MRQRSGLVVDVSARSILAIRCCAPGYFLCRLTVARFAVSFSRRSGHRPGEGVPPRVVEFGDRTGPGSGGGLEGELIVAHGANQEHP